MQESFTSELFCLIRLEFKKKREKDEKGIERNPLVFIQMSHYADNYTIFLEQTVSP